MEQLTKLSPSSLTSLVAHIKRKGRELGFQQVGITDTNLADHEKHLFNWLGKGYHGDMAYMAKHGTKRSRPEQLVPGTIRIIMVRMDYLPPDPDTLSVLNNPELGFIARYTLGRDYHRLLRKRLQRLATSIEQAIGSFNYRVFTDSGPVLEKALAEKAGLGWIGKHTVLINPKAGSWFFLGTLYTDLPLPTDEPHTFHCGSCQACINICPTQAIIGPQQLDARRCISYLTIEYRGIIPIEFRKKMGNRIFGCDDCQLTCPWNKFAKPTQEEDFFDKRNLSRPKLLELFSWDEEKFLKMTEGSAIRRTGYEAWQRNISIALGNAPYALEVIQALRDRISDSSPLVKEHIEWAITEQQHKSRQLEIEVND